MKLIREAEPLGFSLMSGVAKGECSRKRVRI